MDSMDRFLAAAVMAASTGAWSAPGDAVNKMERVSQSVEVKNVVVVGGATASFGNFRIGSDRPAVAVVGAVVNTSGEMRDVVNKVRVAGDLTVLNGSATIGLVQQGK